MSTLYFAFCTMHIHILGICGTFMGGLAVLAKQSGHIVTGCDENVYPPMSTQLSEQGITLIQGYDLDQLSLSADLYVIGNVISRGNPLMEAILNQGLPFISGPQWLGENILRHKWVLAIAGTHGKTSTASMLAWILEDAGLSPGFLIGGIPNNFGISARTGHTDFFVIEADEYDTAFFDKRSKFVHYHAKTAILNNLEYDHADIFADIGAIETQFHHLVRTIPGIGRLIVNHNEPALHRVVARGFWSELEFFTKSNDEECDWRYVNNANGQCELLFREKTYGCLQWSLMGEHNQSNALAAVAAARHTGVTPSVAIDALSRFQGVKRRMEVRGTVNDITVYDDFAHHPTAITATLAGLRKKVGQARILAILEPRSATMKQGIMKKALPDSLNEADQIFAFGAKTGKSAIEWDLGATLSPLGNKVKSFYELKSLIESVVQFAKPGDHIVVMSNGDFGTIHQKILDALAT